MSTTLQNGKSSQFKVDDTCTRGSVHVYQFLSYDIPEHCFNSRSALAYYCSQGKPIIPVDQYNGKKKYSHRTVMLV